MNPAAFYSHIEKDTQGNILFQKLLHEHLEEVSKTARFFANAAHIAEYGRLEHLAEIIGISHDFGKYTSFFQDYLINGNDTGTLKNHSLLSAFWGSYLIFTENPQAYFDALLVFNVVLNHHGNLENIAGLLKNLGDLANPFLKDFIDQEYARKFTVLFKRQLRDLANHSSRIDKDLKKTSFDLPSVRNFIQDFQVGKGDFFQFLMELNNHLEKFIFQDCFQFNFYRHVLFSALIDADKRDAAKIKAGVKRHQINENIVPHFIEKELRNKKGNLAALRGKIFREIDEQARSVDLNQHLFTLTAPTGSGKTLAALNFAIALKNRLQSAKQYNPRIIYVLPFTSIIDQNFEVFKQVTKKFHPQLADDSSFLLKHHHLAEIAYQTGDESYPLDQSLLLTESWESEIVVTTFVQFFDSIITNRNKMLKKFHNITGSVVLLDEVQNIPIEYWPLVRGTLKLLAEKAHCYFVLMTATQPLIFSQSETRELVQSKKEIFGQLNRVQIRHNPQSMSLQDFSNEFLTSLNPQKSYAVILNTIKSSIEFFEMLEQSLTTEHELYYLSTNIVPVHRQQRIEQINSRLEKRQPVILVSTQVIEAGIDFDFDVIYRDFAPVDSIVQASGRANRHGNKAEVGKVHLIHLVSENERPYAQYIYGKAHLFVASQLFEKITQLPEKDFFELVQENYRDLVKICDMSAGEKIFQKWWKECDESVLPEFRLIEEKSNYVNVFVCLDEQAQQIWDRFLNEVYFEKGIRNRRLNFLGMRKVFNQYLISIPAVLAKKHFWDYSGKPYQGIGFIEREMVDDYYHPQTGFIRRVDDDAMFI